MCLGTRTCSAVAALAPASNAALSWTTAAPARRTNGEGQPGLQHSFSAEGLGEPLRPLVGHGAVNVRGEKTKHGGSQPAPPFQFDTMHR